MNRSRSLGFTLIEMIIFIVVAGMAMTGILSVMNTVVKSSADPMVRKQTLAIAESLLEEILLKDYAKPTGSVVVGFPTGSRNLFDCVSDYNGYNTSTGIVDATGASVAVLTAYNFSPPVVVSAATLGALTAKKVTVSVTGPGGTVSLSGYRACDLTPSCPLP